jgi:uncharacterized HAD superfamily protein
MLKIGIDLDDCITYKPEFFRLFTNSMKNVAQIHIITNREQTPESEQNTKEELSRIGIHYDHLIITSEKSRYILENGITVYFDDTDENFLDLPETVTVFKIRESWNFDFEEHKWVYSDRTGRNINKGD